MKSGGQPWPVASLIVRCLPRHRTPPRYASHSDLWTRHNRTVMRHELWRPTARRVTLRQLILINTLHTLHSSQRPPRRRCAPSTSVRSRLQRTAVPVAQASRRTRRRDGVSCCTTSTSAQSRPSRGTSRCTPHVPQPMSCPRLGKLPVAPSEPLALHDARIALQNAANA